MKFLIPALITLFLSTEISAQSSIKINGNNINRLDKKKRKQGEWIYFTDSGYVFMSCFYADDKCISPMVFYENADTAFVRLPRNNNVEHFVLSQGSGRVYGSFSYQADTCLLELEDESLADSTVKARLLHFKNIQIPPVYYFAQKSIHDYILAGFRSGELHTNTSLNVILPLVHRVL